MCCILVYTINYIGLVNKIFLGKELFIRGIPEGLKEKHMINFFKKNGISVESVQLPDNKR